MDGHGVSFSTSTASNKRVIETRRDEEHDTIIFTSFHQPSSASPSHISSTQAIATDRQSSEPVVQAQDISKNYGPFTALQGIDLELYRGEVVGFLGPNGAGKTTTMDIICGTISRSGGQLRIAGKDPAQDPQFCASHIGYLPQYLPLYHDMKVKQYLEHIGRLKNIPQAELQHAVFRVIEQCDLKAVANRHIGKLSGGNRQRTGLAQALLAQPAVLILDEPTAGLDPAQIAIFRQLIRSLANNHSILVSTHIMAEVETCCDRVVMIHQGKNILSESVVDFQQRRNQHADIIITLQQSTAEMFQNKWHEIHNDGSCSILNASTCRLDGDIDRDTAAQLAQSCGGLKELRSEQQSLEAVFSQLIQDEDH